MGRNYRNPPVIEAVCEFRLTPDTKWDLTIPGLIYGKVSKEFPNKEERTIQEVEFVTTEQGLEQRLRTHERVLFLTDDRKTFIQVSPGLLAINALAPYPSWEGFKPRIENAFRALTTEVEIKGLQRIGLRYVNRIQVPVRSVALEDYFNFYPFLGPNLPQDMSNFIVGCILSFFTKRDACRLQLAPAVSEAQDSSALLLDLDYYLAAPQAVGPDNALDWVENAHQQVEQVFEGCLKERLREIFQEVE